MLRIDIVTLFPGMIEGPLAESIPARIQERGPGRHRGPTTCGAGASVGTGASTTHRMAAAPGWSSGRNRSPPRSRHSVGRRRRQSSSTPAAKSSARRRAADLAAREHLILVCPRYEGIDERIRGPRRPGAVDRRLRADRRRVAALVVIDAVIRLLPGAIDAASTTEESFTDGLLEYPQYTRPAVFRGAAASRTS